VAGEVTKLAERTAKATKEIAEMIGVVRSEAKSAAEALGEGTTQAEVGVEGVRKAEVVLRQVVQGAREVDGIVDNIVKAAAEWRASGQGQLSEVTQQAVATREQSAEAFREISILALDLKRTIGEFEGGDGDGLEVVTRRDEARENRTLARPTESRSSSRGSGGGHKSPGQNHRSARAV
jgi:methyl-accepting chemotaxis protein